MYRPVNKFLNGLIDVHADQVLLEVVKPRPFFVSLWAVGRKTFVIFAATCILEMDTLLVPDQIIDGGEAFPRSWAVLDFAFVRIFVSSLVFPIVISESRLAGEENLT